MKFVLVLCMLGLVAAALADDDSQSRGCRYIMGQCVEYCPEGTHATPSYSGGCGRVLPEATCEEPDPVPEEYEICDYSACHCDPGTVRDKKTDKCVTLENCSKE